VAAFASQGGERFGPPSDEQTFRTCVRISGFSPGLLKPGMRATVRIVMTEVKTAVSVPLVCVFTRGMGKSQRQIVWVKRGRSFSQVAVKLGQANEEAVIVESGLEPGTEIALRDLRAEVHGSSLAVEKASGSEPIPIQGGASP
jgi:multidrug efflux pump subunit AcrA (membrane-fusion protein)